MCGIAGLLLSNVPEHEAEEVVRASLRTIAHRGEPRFQQEIWGGDMGFAGVNRLAFTSGEIPQPTADPAKRYRLFLNGEIYSLHGSTRHASDTQAITDLIAKNGIEAALNLIEGMFALVMIDLEADCFYLARDPFGIKPLYYAVTDRGVMVASEIKALVRHAFVEQVCHVEPATIMKFTRAGPRDEGRIRVDSREDSGLTYEGFTGALREALSQSVREQTRDGQTYGIYLSGGLDSSSVYALARIEGVPIVPLVLGTASASDVAAAKQITSYFGDHLVVVDCPSEAELFADLAETVRICESFEPNVVRQSAATRVLAEGAKKQGCRVALCGEGADELFGGYPEFWRAGVHFDDIRSRFLGDLPRTQLQRVDRCNMNSTVEVRVPFLSKRVASLAFSRTQPQAFARSMDGAYSKRPLREAMSELLPPAIINRPKIVLSEGAGLRGNSPTDGMFCDLVEETISRIGEPAADTLEEWGIMTAEEALYFRHFESFGYTAYEGARKRVFANATATLF